ncbi:MAG: hypothetical protein ACR2N1_01815 [Rubripirellula sp.]
MTLNSGCKPIPTRQSSARGHNIGVASDVRQDELEQEAQMRSFPHP